MTVTVPVILVPGTGADPLANETAPVAETDVGRFEADRTRQQGIERGGQIRDPDKRRGKIRSRSPVNGYDDNKSGQNLRTKNVPFYAKHN